MGPDNRILPWALKAGVEELERAQSERAATVEERSETTGDAERTMFRNRRRRGLLAYTNDESGGSQSNLNTTLG